MVSKSLVWLKPNYNLNIVTFLSKSRIYEPEAGLSGSKKAKLKEKKMKFFFKDEEGATAVEYCIMVAFIALVIISSVTLLGINVSSKFNQFSTDLAAAS